MSTFFRYLMSLVMHLAWRRAGRGGPIPPVRLPGKKGKNVDLPVIGTWQLMAAMWLLKKFWTRYGSDVTSHLKNNANDLARRASTLLPDLQAATQTAHSAALTKAAAKAAPAVAPATQSVPAPRPIPNLQTQPLSPQATTPQTTATQPSSVVAAQNTAPAPDIAPASPSSNGAPTQLPSGSLLSKLRGRS